MIRTTVVNHDKLKIHALLFHYGTYRGLHVLFVVVASHEHRHERHMFTLFGLHALREGLHVNVFRHLFGKHVGYGVFHLSLRTAMASATSVTKFSNA